MTKRALIFGISGQDGAYLAQLLVSKGYEVHGTSRDAETARLGGLHRLGIFDHIHLHSTNLTEARNVIQVLQSVAPDEIYNLSAQSSVGLSFEQPIETLHSIVDATINVLEAIRLLNSPARFYNASSSEMFGDTEGAPATETTRFQPRSPYGIAKATAHWLIQSYRNAYGMYACSGILFNHESPLRSERFVTQKIVRAAVGIAAGSSRRLQLGDTTIVRDWGWAPEYVKAMWQMLQQDQPDDFVVATGIGTSLTDFVASTFSEVGLDWHDHVDFASDLKRPYEIQQTIGDASKARLQLGWQPSFGIQDVISQLVQAEVLRREEQ